MQARISANTLNGTSRDRTGQGVRRSVLNRPRSASEHDPPEGTNTVSGHSCPQAVHRLWTQRRRLWTTWAPLPRPAAATTGSPGTTLRGHYNGAAGPPRGSRSRLRRRRPPQDPARAQEQDDQQDAERDGVLVAGGDGTGGERLD